MALLATQTIDRAGLDPAYVAASGGGDEFAPSGDALLHVKASGAAVDVTIVTPKEAAADVGVEDLVVNVPGGEERLIGPLPGTLFANPADGRGDVTYSQVTGVTVALLSLSR